MKLDIKISAEYDSSKSDDDNLNPQDIIQILVDDLTETLKEDIGLENIKISILERK